MAGEDTTAAVKGLTQEQIWRRPGGAASIGFHLAHLAGSTDRLLTYARAESLSEHQLRSLAAEASLADTMPGVEVLLARWHEVIENALRQIGSTPESTLADAREVGRAKLPSTVIGLIFHAAEHAQRHAGQIVATAKIIRGTP